MNLKIISFGLATSLLLSGCLGNMTNCPKCNGNGKVIAVLGMDSDWACTETNKKISGMDCADCSRCSGTGRVKACRKCDGTKFVDRLNERCNYCNATGIDPG
jgi:hypothetical protein